MHFNITSYCRVKGSGGWESGWGLLVFVLESLKKRDREELVVSYQNKSRFFFSVTCQLLESIYAVLIFHHKHWCCAKKFMYLVQSEKAVTVVPVMSSATSQLPSGSQGNNLA